MNLSNILKGTRINYEGIQSISGLTIIPLVCDRVLSFDDKYASPFAHKVSNSRYGQVIITKDSTVKEKALLVPANMVYVASGYGAQDHLISKGTLVKNTRMTTTLNDSRCMDRGTGGALNGTKTNLMYIAPMSIREIAYNHVGIDEYGKLWPDIAKFNSVHGSGGQAVLKDYFKKWNPDLDKFIAHFERLDNCIGFITLYNDEVVAIDKFPSFTYTGEVWERLVRDSYAALVIKDQVSKTKQTSKLKRINGIKGKTSVRDIYDTLVKDRTEHYKTLLSEIIEIDFKETKDKDNEGSVIVKSDGYIGQVINDNDINVMVSIVKKESFNPDQMRVAREMKKVAQSQSEFKL